MSDIEDPEAVHASPERQGDASATARGLDWSLLMTRAQDGERETYRLLLEDITPYLRSLAARFHRDQRDIEDSVQDVLLTVHAIRHTYDPGRPFGPWLVAIANRRMIDRLRIQGRSSSRESEFTEEHETFAAPEANFHEAASDARALHRAVERLPVAQREAIELLKLREMSLKEASSESGMSIPGLKVATHRALKNLRKILDKQGFKP
ncbi:MAG: sigma-70 family RNA polymerase sigma factor [Burkholderiaceae bacterium]